MRLPYSLMFFPVLLIGLHKSASGHQPESSVTFRDNSEWQSYFTETDYICVSAENGIAIAPAYNAAIYARNIDDGAVIFRKHFDIPLQPTAVIIATDITMEQSKFLEENGLHAMPWLSEAAKHRQKKSAIIKQVEQQTEALPANLRQQATSQALSQLGLDEDIKQVSPDEKELGSLTHEIGHDWFKRWYNGGIKTGLGDIKSGEVKYGSTAPDWLDEMAAILSENNILAEQRRQSINTLFDAENGQLKTSLQSYMSMEHPLLNAVQKTLLSKKDAERLTSDSKKEVAGKMVTTKSSRIIKLTGDEAKEFLAANNGNGAIEFYIQTRALADFLIEKTGDEYILYKIATHIRGGGTFGTWLVKAEAQYNLPATEEDFSQEWQEWMRQKIAV